MQHLNSQVRALVVSAEQSNDLKRQIRTLTLFAQLGSVYDASSINKVLVQQYSSLCCHKENKYANVNMNLSNCYIEF